MYRNIYIKINKIKTSFLSRKRAITTFLSRKFMITRLSIALEDFLGSSIASQVMPPCFIPISTMHGILFCMLKKHEINV